MTWEMKHSVIANADRQAVWAWHSNVDNWARFEGDAVESITLYGPFQAGTLITTKMPGQEPRYSTLTEVEAPCRSVIEMELPGAVLRFGWTFEELSDRQTRLTQHIRLEGQNAEEYVPIMEEFFSPNIEKGMQRIADEITGQESPGA